VIQNRQSIRGACPGDFTEDDFYRCGQHLGSLGLKKIVIAHDPRPSSLALYEAFISGCLSQSITVLSLGCTPTPVVNFYRQQQTLKCGVMITASHNPVTDNGIKLFLQDPVGKIQLLKLKKLPLKAKGRVIDVKKHALYLYAQSLRKKFPNLTRKKCLIDTANGSWDYIKPTIEFFFDATYVNSGCAEKINQNAAIFSPQRYQQCAKSYDAVLLLDGDGDRLNVISSKGELLDGDDFLYQLYHGEPNHMVGTIMSNSALEEFVKQQGYHFYRTGVGDDLVINQVKKLGLRYGGEQCGHVMDANWLDSTDPLYLSLLLLSQDKLSPLPYKYPQHHMNLMGYRSIDHLKRIIAPFAVRSIIRHSNTEKLTRVMLEGDAKEVKTTVEAINHQTHPA
jgi:phosphoglucosamine mutase